MKNASNDTQMKKGLDEIRPDVDDSDNCAKHYNKNYLEKIDPANKMVGDMDFLKLVEQYDSYKKEIKPKKFSFDDFLKLPRDEQKAIFSIMFRSYGQGPKENVDD